MRYQEFFVTRLMTARCFIFVFLFFLNGAMTAEAGMLLGTVCFYGCDLRLMVASDGNPEDEIIQEFKVEFESKKKACAVLIVRATSNSEKWTIAGFDDVGKFRTVPINDPNNELSKELKKKPINKSRIVELATSSLGRTQGKDKIPLATSSLGRTQGKDKIPIDEKKLDLIPTISKGKIEIKPRYIANCTIEMTEECNEKESCPKGAIQLVRQLKDEDCYKYRIFMYPGKNYYMKCDQPVGWCDLRLMVASDGNAEDEIIHEFEMEFESRKKECAVLIVRTTGNPEKWTIAGFDDVGKFRTVVIDDSSHELSKEFELSKELSKELKKKPINRSRIVELATLSLGRPRDQCETNVVINYGSLEKNTNFYHSLNDDKCQITPSSQK